MRGKGFLHFFLYLLLTIAIIGAIGRYLTNISNYGRSKSLARKVTVPKQQVESLLLLSAS
jgi:hypothetical protein